MIIRKLILYLLLLPVICSAETTSVLTIYAPDYFISEWGPGPKIEEAFEKKCNCDLKFISGNPLSKLMLEGKSTTADILIGLSSDNTLKARQLNLLDNINFDFSLPQLPINWKDSTFLPFDWSYVAFIFDNTKIKNPPKTFIELANDPRDYKIIIQDPRTSPSGLALVLWIKSIYGEEAFDVWSKLSSKILTVTKGWSESYGMFTSGEAEMVLSFITSEAYHKIAENDNTKTALIMDEGHYVYVELAAKVYKEENQDLSNQFMEFILTQEFQKIIPLYNWSFPVNLSEENWPKGFQDLPKPKKSIFLNEENSAEIKNFAIEEWLKAMTK
ncbi:MAG: thiamine ABC transporter substrate binding subunit [Paracoccaceae bacterium]